jgi:hypothetical protein
MNTPLNENNEKGRNQPKIAVFSPHNIVYNGPSSISKKGGYCLIGVV